MAEKLVTSPSFEEQVESALDDDDQLQSAANIVSYVYIPWSKSRPL